MAVSITGYGMDIQDHALLAAGVFKGIRDWLVLQQLRYQVHQERQALLDLPDEILRDMGISRAEAELESQRDYKDVPQARLDAEMGKRRG